MFYYEKRLDKIIIPLVIFVILEKNIKMKPKKKSILKSSIFYNIK